MNIIVCIKRVPATDSKIKVGADGRSIDPAGVDFVLNPYDEFAVEQALKTKEQLGAGQVTVVSLGSADAQKELRSCLAMGADAAVLLDDGGKPRDAHATASAVAAWLRTVPHDVVFCGKQAVDHDDSQFAGRLAALLGVPSVTEVVALELSDGTFRAERDIEGAREVVRCGTPCVISTQKGLNEPRSATLKGIMAAKKKPLETVAADVPAPGVEVVSLELPPERKEGRILGSVDELIAALRTEAKVL
ncbi:MAG: electron transfer flavoprotein subunit beta/FixA family protein [Planctomycetota bacterium]|nr:electron transfer flavoprotein subunit beta/FixA family protein [Planctomycetota bacterium]MDA0934370.1 electron transfer flavoprotein subunit beta/FixA family protein [Planctomycetota bacterium]MDA1220699.1 electron transfer flavoprotein subunit beta/FixA family protein [Planctomycetota bacterium]